MAVSLENYESKKYSDLFVITLQAWTDFNILSLLYSKISALNRTCHW